MDTVSNYFYVTLFNNDWRKYYKDDTLATFTIKLTQPIYLGTDENWEVGIFEITFLPPSACTIKSVLIVVDTNFLVHCNLISRQFML